MDGLKFSYNNHMSIYKDFIENSIDPFILFNSNGNIIEYNKEGEYVLSLVPKDELFNLAVSHASMSFGFKQTFLDLDIGHSSYCAITVGYKDSDTIGLMMHKNVCSKKLRSIQSDLQSANIFTLIDIALNTNLGSNTKVVAEYDVSIPEFKLNINKFLLLLNKIFKSLQKAKEIYIRVAIATGQSIKIENKKYQVVAIEIRSPEVAILDIKDEDFIISFDKEKLTIELPFIQ